MAFRPGSTCLLVVEAVCSKKWLSGPREEGMVLVLMRLERGGEQLVVECYSGFSISKCLDMKGLMGKGCTQVPAEEPRYSGGVEARQLDPSVAALLYI